MMEKKCTVCKLTKPIEKFYARSNGIVNSECKECHKKACKEYVNKNRGKVYKKYKVWQTENKEKRKLIKQRWIDKNPDYHKNYRESHKEKQNEYNKIYYWKDPEKHREKSKMYRKNNPKHLQYYISSKLKTDINFRIAYNMRHRIIYAVKHKKTNKITKTNKLIGCSTQELKSYIESMFVSGMNWNNYGKVWQIDHIIPCSSFDLTVESEQLKCFHYTNLQPLFTVTTVVDGITYIGNRNKGRKII